jgi:hypothetical protein
MRKQIATVCCAMLVQGSVVIAAEPTATPASHVTLKDGPLLRASQRRLAVKRLSTEPEWNAQLPAVADDPDTRSWMERHPVWTGTLVGFAAGFAITYATTGNKNDGPFDEMRLESASVFSGVSAGIGALVGWGIGRSQDDGYHNRSRVVAPTKSK